MTYIGMGECRYGNSTVVQGYKSRFPLSTDTCLYFCNNWEPCTGVTLKWKNSTQKFVCFIHGDRLHYPWGDYYNNGFKLFPDYEPEHVPYNISYSKFEEDRTVCYSIQDTARKCYATYPNGTQDVCIFPYLDEDHQPMVSCDQWNRCAVKVEGVNNNVVEYANCSCPPQFHGPTPARQTGTPAALIQLPTKGLSTVSLVIIVVSLFCTTVSLTTLTLLIRYQRRLNKIKSGFLLNQQISSTNSLLGGYRYPSIGEMGSRKGTPVSISTASPVVGPRVEIYSNVPEFWGAESNDNSPIPTPPIPRKIGSGQCSPSNSSLTKPRRHFRFELKSVKESELLGCGAFGSVYRALGDTGELFAVKKIQLVPGIDLEGARREYRMMSELAHPNVVGVRDFITDREEGTVRIIMEFLAGGSLAKIVREFGTLQIKTITNYLQQMLAGLSHLHENKIVHSDIKPANILVHSNGDVKLTDFGLSRFAMQQQQQRQPSSIDDSDTYAVTRSVASSLSTSIALATMKSLSLTGGSDGSLTTGTLDGTIPYMSPNVVRHLRYTPQSDIWALACTIQELASGIPPWLDEFRLPGDEEPILTEIGGGRSPNFTLDSSPDSEYFPLMSFVTKCFSAEATGISCLELINDVYLWGEVIS